MHWQMMILLCALAIGSALPTPETHLATSTDEDSSRKFIESPTVPGASKLRVPRAQCVTCSPGNRRCNKDHKLVAGICVPDTNKQGKRMKRSVICSTCAFGKQQCPRGHKLIAGICLPADTEKRVKRDFTACVTCPPSRCMCKEGYICVLGICVPVKKH